VDKLERKEVVGAGGSEGVTVVYVIGVTRTADGITTGMDLYFSTEGVLVNEVTNAADDGYEDYIPEKPAAGIEQQIQGYLDDNGGGSVIDVDREYGFGHGPLSVCIFEPCRIVGPGFRPGSLEEKVRHSIVASKGPSYILGTRITSVKSRQYLLRNM